ncbi:MAG: hypothetical protein IT355_19430 [Gemmatimonadaceae bacterium]|nr:hypothetical protein [Gemmatimonadaceae bacterium]
MTSVRRLCVPLATLALLGACSSGGGAPAAAGAPAPAPAARRPRQDQQLITRDVIIGTQYTNLYDVVQALRSNWLTVRSASGGAANTAVLQVYLDNQRIGGVEELRRILPSTVQSARFYDPISASARWGMDHGAGAIYVVTAK